MKKLLLVFILIILFIFGFNKYQDYKRFNGPITNYEANSNIDSNYHNKSVLFNYQNTITQLNGFINTQWSAHHIDVINPEKENKQTQYAVNVYAQKLAQVQHYESILQQSAKMKEKGLNNADIKLFEESGLKPDAYKISQQKKQYNQIIRNSFTNTNIVIGKKSALIFEVQKMLTKNGFPVVIDGFFKTETSDGLKAFETKNNLLPDGKLDAISLEYLLENN